MLHSVLLLSSEKNIPTTKLFNYEIINKKLHLQATGTLHLFGQLIYVFLYSREING